MTFLTTTITAVTLTTLLTNLFTTWGARGQNISLVYTIDEEKPSGTFVGDVAQDSNIRDLVGSEQEFRDLTYSFLAEEGGVANNFRLQSNSGMLTTARQLDRETLCSFLPQCRLSLRVAAQSSLGLFFKIIDVTVALNDVNDNAPVFIPSVAEVLVMENANVGDRFQLPPASDADTGANHSVQDYLLLESDGPFSLQTEGSMWNDPGLWLQLTGGLDRETVDSYRVLMVAKDGGQPALSGTLTINVKIGDVNDHTPVWDQTQRTVNVSEITAVGTTILTLSAYDADKGDNGRLTYRFPPLQPDIALGLFALNRTTGQLRVAKSLDSYAGNTYTLEVEARDSGTPFKSSRTQVVIRVLDTHNSKPEIILSIFGQPSMAVLSEFSELGRVVAHIAIVDPDKGLNGIVVCDTEASHFQLQAMDVRQFKVILSRPLDRETSETHLVNVTCHDAGNPPLSATRSFTVRVIDENDETPVFSKTRYEARVNETAAGSRVRDVYITTLSATDKDVGENARLSFRIMDDPRNEFRVLNNGTVLATRGLDRETGESPRFLQIIAHDHGKIENSATATLVLTILDVNDNRPVFTDSNPILHVSEGAPRTSYAGNVTATDDDAEENAIVLYRMHPAYEGRVPFKVITDGVIKTNGTLDRETRDRYEFAVIAYDLGKPQLSSTATVTVRVMDDNDNSPVFVFPNEMNNTVSVPHTLSPNTAVTSLRAYDIDFGRNGELVYSRDGRNGTRYFDVKPGTGEVLLVRSLSDNEVGDHVLTVVVHDLGFPTQLANQSLLIIHVYRGNHSAVATSSAEAIRNTVLAFVIVGVTVVLIVAVILTILLMKRSDRQRRLYRAKEEECKVDANLRQLTNKHLTQECDMSTTGSDVSATSSEPRRRKEVSFSLDEDNNITPGHAAMMFETVAADSLEAIPEVTQSQVDGNTVLGVVRYRADVRPMTCATKGKDSHRSSSLTSILRAQQQRYHDPRDLKQKCLLEPRGQDDNMSDVSCDVSTSDSGRGGSDVEMHSHHVAAKESGDAPFSSHRGPSQHSLDSRRHPHGSHHPQQQQQQQPQQPRSVTFDLYPTTFSPRGSSGRSGLTTFPTSHLSSGDDASPSDDPRHTNMTSFSSFSPLARTQGVAATTPASSSGSSAMARASPVSSFSGNSTTTSSSLPLSSRGRYQYQYQQQPQQLHHHPPQQQYHNPASSRHNRGSRDMELEEVRGGGMGDDHNKDSSSNNLPLPHPASSSHYEGEGEDGSYVDLKRQQRRGGGGGGGGGSSVCGGVGGGSQQAPSHGDYMDMTGANYVPSSHLSVGTTMSGGGTWDGETTTSGSYTVDPHELTQEIDKLFFDTPKDVVV